MNAESKCFSHSLLESDTTIDFPMLCLLMHSLLEYLSLWFATAFVSHFLLEHILSSSTTNKETREGSKMKYTVNDDGTCGVLLLRREIFKAIHIPQLFHIITLLVHIYEHSPTVRVLGMGLVLIYQKNCISCVLERTVKCKMSNEGKTLDEENGWFWVLLYRFIPGFPLLVAFAFQWIVSAMVGEIIQPLLVF